MTEGIQITIPDFDDDNLNSGPTPFGRSGFGFGGGYSVPNSALDSPGAGGSATPLGGFGERSFFSHARGDSSASIESTSSATTRYTTKPNTPFAHSSQSSIATTSTAFSKKPSFASIRNAFKSGKSSEPPPVPQIDHTPYPVLKNPFNRSTSSLNQSTNRSTMSPFGQRPPTPGATESKGGRSKAKGHAHAKSQHSHTGSIFNASEGGSDLGHGFPSTPPPVPRVPHAFGNLHRSDTPPTSDFEEDKAVVMDPKTPSDYALHATFLRFATSAEGKIDSFLRHPLDQDPLLEVFMAPGVDVKFDETLNSLGIIAQKNAKPVLDSIMRWRRTQNDNVGSDIIRPHLAQSTGPNRTFRAQDVPGLLNERKSLASIYIMCRALVAVLQSLSKDALGDAMGHSLEDTTFEQFRQPNLKLLTTSANHRTNAELYATLLGHLANIRFMTVTDRFLAELGPVASGQVPKDLDMKYEHLVQGLKHIKIKVWPPEAFEEGAEFMESLSKSYVKAHGLRLKIAFAETLILLLHPIGKTAQAETNNPQWAKAIEIIFPKAKEMMSKPRYWHVAFPLAITSLCMAPQQYFLKHWPSCFESSISKLKDKPYRAIVMNGILRLIWTYLYRCQESPSTTLTKLENVLKQFFPPNRLTIYPADEHLAPLVYIIHFVLSRHFEFGRDFCLELMQEPMISSLQKSGNIGSALAPERTSIAIRAILLSLYVLESEAASPSWPSISDFSALPTKEDYPTSSAYLPASLQSKVVIKDFLDRVGTTLASIATFCGNAVGHMCIFDDQWSYSRLNVAYEETHNFVVRRQVDGVTTAYPAHSSPHVSLLQTCFQSWPRCLHPSIAVEDAIDMLLRGVIHVEPTLGQVAGAALKRFMEDRGHAMTVVARFSAFLFNPNRIAHEAAGIKLFVESSRLLAVWVAIVEDWVRNIVLPSSGLLAEEKQIILTRCDDIEAAALFLLSHESATIHESGVKVARLLGLILPHRSTLLSSDDSHFYFIGRLHEKGENTSFFFGFDELLNKAQLARLEQWRELKRESLLLRMAEGKNERDPFLWRFIFPAFLQTCMNNPGITLGLLRNIVVSAASRYHPTISHLAGLSSRVPAGLTRSTSNVERDGVRLVKDNKHLVDQWHLWVKILCSTAALPDASRPAFTPLHSRGASDANFERERLSSTRGLFRYLTPFLDSEYTPFRDAAVLCISSFPSNTYPQLLEDLSLLAGRQFYDDPRSKPGSGSSSEHGPGGMAGRQVHEGSKLGGGPLQVERSRRQERLQSAVARIYCLTAHCLQQQRSAGRQAALANVLKFVRNTQAFLSTAEMRQNYTLQRLRRYFCGTVERLFDGLATLKDSDRFIPPHMHLSLYRLCEDWCQVGQQSDAVKRRFNLMQKAVSESAESQDEAAELQERFRHEAMLLSHAAIGALASLCHKAFFPPDTASTSPTDREPSEFTKPLTPLGLLDRLSAILASPHQPSQVRGRKALRSILAQSGADSEFLQEALGRASIVTEKLDTSNERIFEAVCDVVCNEAHDLSFCQVVCLGLTNLRHPTVHIRIQSFNILEAIHQQSSGLLTMSNFEATVGSLAAGTYIHAHRLISDFLAGEHPEQATIMLAQLGNWLPHLPGEAYDTNAILLLLQSLEFWISNINLMTDDKSRLSQSGLTSLYHLMSLSLRYGTTHSEQILALWTRLVEPPNQSNGHATVRFLLEQCHKVGSTIFIRCAANIVACLSQTPIGRQVFGELCSVIEPARMLPIIDHKLIFPEADDLELWEELDVLFAEQPRLTLGSAQFAWLFLTDVALQRYWEMKSELPTLLHVLLTHLDHRIPFLRDRARGMLFQLLRCWTPGYDELPERSATRIRSAVKAALAKLEKDATSYYWKEEESSAEAEPKMRWICRQIIGFLEPLAPSLVGQWGSLALIWGTSCSIRAIAFRSLQTFRALMPRVKKADLALLLGRLSNTVAASDINIQSFTSEIFLTLSAVANTDDLDKSLLPQLFWCASACLSTTVEREFTQTLSLLDILLRKVDLDDSSAVDFLLSQRPNDWKGSPYLQPALLKGLRSSSTSTMTMNILQTLAKVHDDRLIDPSEGRVRDLYTAALPWCLHAMDQQDTSLREFAEDIGILSAQEGKQSIQKIMNSFAKGHFRTRDDFLRQSVSSLREHYGLHNWTEIVTLLLGLVLNKESWLRIQAMQILKVFFQQRGTRNPMELLGSELLMPLLRLLETDLAPQALDVLEEPMAMSGGPAARHVLRMSMHVGNLPLKPDTDSVTTVFGVPEESGWSIAQADVLQGNCRDNMLAVFDTCSMPSRPSRIEFEPEVSALASVETRVTEDLGGLVKNLHDLNNYFQAGDPTQAGNPLPLPTRRLEARIAAILAKSTASDTVNDTPQTPFLDVFRIGGMEQNFEESDEDSDSDSDVDAFIFDSPYTQKSTPNGVRHH